MALNISFLSHGFSYCCSTGRASARLLSVRRTALLAALLGCCQVTPALAQQQGYGQTLGTGQQQRELDYGSGPSRNSGGILDSTNPIDLMNKIRRGTAMDDATPPGDAIDAALKDFQAQSTPEPSVSPSAPVVRPVQ